MTLYTDFTTLQQPQPPLPPDTGIVRQEFRGEARWYPVYVALDGISGTHYEPFGDPNSRAFLCYRDRRKAIGYLWRRHRRGDLEYSVKLVCVPGVDSYRLDYCAGGVAGNLYQRQTVTVNEAVERLGVKKSWILQLIREHKLPAKLVTGKGSGKEKWKFYNFYSFSLAKLEAYIDVHGYIDQIPSYAEAKRAAERAGRTLPIIIWCV